MKSCNINLYYEKSQDLESSLYCFIDEFLLMTERNFFLLCTYPNWVYTVKPCKCPGGKRTTNFCESCAFYQDCCTYAGEFNELTLSSGVLKIATTFILFFRILNYWKTVNKKMLDDYFEFLPVFDHVWLQKNIKTFVFFPPYLYWL